MFTILHTEASDGWGGQEIRIFEESKRMIQNGHKVILAAPQHSMIYKKFKEHNIPAFQAEFQKKNPVSILKFISIINEIKPDIVNTHSSSDSWVASIAAKLSKCKPKIIRTRHLSTPISKTFTSRIVYDILPDAVMTTGESIKQRMVSHNNFHADKIFPVPTGVDIRRFDPSKVKPSLPKKGFLIGTIGVLRDWKGHNYFLESIPIISKQIPDAVFYIVGEGPWYPKLEKIVNELNIHNKVIFTGHREDIPEILASLDVVIHPSFAGEGVPQSLLQAMAMEKPIVASDAGSIKEIIINGKTGFLIAPRDANAIAEKVLELYNNAGLRDNFGKNARKFVEENHSFEKMIEKIELLYEKINVKERAAK